MKLVQRHQDDSLIFDLIGDFDSRSAGAVKDEFRAVIEDGSYSLVINMADVPYIDSAGLGALVSAMKTAKEKGGNVLLSGLTAQVKMVIELTRLNLVFEIFDNVDDALASLSTV